MPVKTAPTSTPKKKIVERSQNERKLWRIYQRAYGFSHQFHAEHQDGESHHDRAGATAAIAFGNHDQDDTNQCQQRRKRFWLQQPHPHRLALDAGK